MAGTWPWPTWHQPVQQTGINSPVRIALYRSRLSGLNDVFYENDVDTIAVAILDTVSANAAPGEVTRCHL